MNMTIEEYKECIRQFEIIRPDYLAFADFLDQVLNKAAGKFGFLAIVQTRAKSVASFSSKIIIRNKYSKPLKEITDLCGARMILHFQSQVEKMCTFIKENFEIDEAKSLDQKSKLKVNEFGYRSIHYIVTLKKDAILGIPVPAAVKDKKAEIQVRTLAEHVWADISHDRIYKPDLVIPEEWRRQAARLSAILEDADIDFGNMSREIDQMARVFELQYETAKTPIEIEKLNTLISVLRDKQGEAAGNVLKLSSIFRAMGNYSEAADLLKPWLNKPANPILNLRLWFEYGLTMSLTNCQDVHSADYASGLKAIHHSLGLIEQLPSDILTDYNEEISNIFYRYGKLLQRNEEESNAMHSFFRRAHQMMPENPLYLVALLESVVMRNIDTGKYSVELFKAGMEKAITSLKLMLEMGVKRVTAWFAIGRCYFFTGDEMKCIEAYSHAVSTILDERYHTSLSSVLAEIDFAGRLKRFNYPLAKQIQIYLNIALACSDQCADKARFRNFLKNQTLRTKGFKTPVVIVAGGAALMDEEKVDVYTNHIRELMHGFNGTIISGGTTAGIPGLVGKVKKELQQNGQVDFDLLAYLPKKLPANAHESEAYDAYYYSENDRFSSYDIFTCWSDLISNGIDPSEVILIGIDGGHIATLEYMIALSLGATVGLISYSGRAVSELLQNKTWKDHPKLLPLPNDPLTVWALVNQNAETLLSQDEINTLAPEVHEFYRLTNLETFNPKTNDINKYKVLMPWDKLDPNLQRSNLRQVAFYELMLRRVNLGIRKTNKPTLFNIKNNVSKEEYDFLAKLEHARWNAERLMDGWRYGQEKDLAKKLNPCIVSWDKLDEETRRYDYDPVDNIPLLLGKIGYEVFKINSNH
jgi:ppGpp synthetase/RelA/SpoT-type nucleotidyltranferase